MIWKKAFVAVGIAVTLVLSGATAPTHTAGAMSPVADSVLRILVEGDSISAPCGQTPPAGWCAEFGSLLTQAGIPHVIMSRAVGGVDCGYLSARIQKDLTETAPNLVLLNCGTNNATETPAQRDLMGEQWRTIVEASYVYGARIGISFIEYSDPDIQKAAGRSWLVPSEGRANDVIYTNMQYYWNYSMFSALADFQVIPGNLDHLKPAPDGIHPNARGEREMGDMWYTALRNGTIAGTGYPWPDIAPKPCGLWGYREGYEPRTYIPCTGIS